MNSMRYNCIIFDCDGVLVDSEKISAKVFHEMVAELGCRLEFETVLEQITGTSMKANLKFFEACVGRELPASFEAEFRKRSYEAFKTELQPIPGVHELLKKIRVPVAVASSGPATKIRQNLTTTHLLERFDDHVFSCYDIESWKPEPDIYLHAAKTMGFQPSECAVVEDSLAGVKAAKGGGFDVFALASHGSQDKLDALGATVFFSMDELGRLLGIS
ncbi:HAD family hydrolase [Sunxiuqinia sp. sy24]|uniref:HAD family hydrolase n=1 Tax=Sunxiuqinia sp. sy24 TaxID=3461495 RepID=UPI0040462276